MINQEVRKKTDGDEERVKKESFMGKRGAHGVESALPPPLRSPSLRVRFFALIFKSGTFGIHIKRKLK
jgi:hypothetical protein